MHGRRFTRVRMKIFPHHEAEIEAEQSRIRKLVANYADMWNCDEYFQTRWGPTWGECLGNHGSLINEFLKMKKQE